GTELVNDSGATLDEIVARVKKVGGFMQEISASSRQQASGIAEINKAVSHIDAITQQNTTLAGEISATNESSLK
ncbi:MAG: methyl-accepting chemotaxis protein, partial [Gammaproteobacteria bacterium]